MWLEPRGEAGGVGGAGFERMREPDGRDDIPSPDRVLSSLYRDEAAALRLYVKRVVRNASDAEDIVQESFLRLWRALECGGIRCPRAVLFRTARNLAFNHSRDCRLRNSDAMRAAWLDAFWRVPPTAEDVMIAGEDAEACQDLLEQLPARCREAFVLRVVDELSYKEISRQMRLSVSTIEKHIGKGRRMCRERHVEGHARPQHAPSLPPVAAEALSQPLLAAE